MKEVCGQATVHLWAVGHECSHHKCSSRTHSCVHVIFWIYILSHNKRSKKEMGDQTG